MNDKNRNLLIGGAATVLLGLFALSFLIKEELPVPKPAPIVEEVHMPPPPPAATPEQIAASEAAAKAAAQAEAETLAAADRKAAELKAANLLEAKRKSKAKAVAAAKPRDEAAPSKSKVTYTKGNRTVSELAPAAPVAAAEDPAKPKEARFNMTQGGKKMTPEDFDAWMKAQGIRIVPAKPAPAAVPAAEEK